MTKVSEEHLQLLLVALLALSFISRDECGGLTGSDALGGICGNAPIQCHQHLRTARLSKYLQRHRYSTRNKKGYDLAIVACSTEQSKF